jgi:hypothetical protein
MSKQSLKLSIAAVIKANGIEDITGDKLQEKLFEIIDATFTEIILLTASDFTGDNYQKNALIGLTPDIDFELFSNTGSGTMLQVDNGYTFDINYGVITTSPENYKLKIYK